MDHNTDVSVANTDITWFALGVKSKVFGMAETIIAHDIL